MSRIACWAEQLSLNPYLKPVAFFSQNGLRRLYINFSNIRLKTESRAVITGIRFVARFVDRNHFDLLQKMGINPG